MWTKRTCSSQNSKIYISSGNADLQGRYTSHKDIIAALLYTNAFFILSNIKSLNLYSMILVFYVTQ